MSGDLEDAEAAIRESRETRLGQPRTYTEALRGLLDAIEEAYFPTRLKGTHVNALILHTLDVIRRELRAAEADDETHEAEDRAERDAADDEATKRIEGGFKS